MRPLPELEPRIPLNPEDLPLTISEPGSYYLLGSVHTTGGGITVTASNVSIDLMGHTLAGGTGDGIDGADVLGTIRNLSVVNGTITGWDGYGVNLGPGSLVRDLRVSGTGEVGISVGAFSIVVDSVAESNDRQGILADTGSIIRGCLAGENDLHGIGGSTDVLVVDSVADNNGGYGIGVASNSEVRGSVAVNNKGIGISVGAQSAVIDCSAVSNQSYGIYVSVGATIHGCNAGFNHGDGIQVSADSLVLDNRCTGNGAFQHDGAGIHATSEGNRIDGNHVVGNDRGIDVDAAGNLVIRNTLRGNTVNFDIVAGNDVGPGGSGATSTSPWANLEF
jgi:parallel beta-helix repeat protein